MKKTPDSGIFLLFLLSSLCGFYASFAELRAETSSNAALNPPNETMSDSIKSPTKAVSESPNFQWLYFGTSTAAPTDEMKAAGIPQSEGLYVGRFSPETGVISDVRLAVKMISSSFIAVDDQKGILYVVGQADAKDGGANVYAYKIDRTNGGLSYINRQPSGGSGVCHLALHPKRTFLAVANYSSGDFAVMRINDDGSVGETTGFVKKAGKGPNQRRQDGPKGHAAYFIEHQGKTRVAMVDLGSDKVYLQLLDEKTGKIQDDPEIPVLECPPGSGPRHLAWSVDKQGNLVVYVLNELDSTLSVFGLQFGDEKTGQKAKTTTFGTWTTIEEKYRDKLTDEVSLVDGVRYTYGNKTSEIEVLPFGESLRVYASNRGQNSVVVFDVDSFQTPDDSPQPVLIQREPTNGQFPRYFTSDPSGRFLIVSNKMSGTVFVFALDSLNGTLELTSEKPLQLAWVIAMGFATPRSE